MESSIHRAKTEPIAWLMKIAVFVVKSNQRDDAREWNRTISEGRWNRRNGRML